MKKIKEYKKLCQSDGIYRGTKKGISYMIRSLKIKPHNLFLKLPEEQICRFLKMRAKYHPNYTDAHPLKITYIDPTKITHYSQIKRPIKWGKVSDGTWDTPCESFVDRHIVRGIHRYVSSNDDTILRSAIADRLENASRPVWGHTTTSDVNKRMREIDELIESIRENGYVLQRNITQNDGWSGTYYYPDILNEVTINIGRDGTPYYVYCGQHRLAIAQALGLNEIPVLVSYRHRNWQDIRDILRSASEGKELPPFVCDVVNHPDLNDIVQKDNVDTTTFI